MGFCSCTARSVLGILGLVFWVMAGTLWFIATYVIVTYKHYDKFLDATLTLLPAVILIAVGLILFFAGLLGCCGMCKDNRCILCMFSTFLSIVLVLLVTGAVLTNINAGKIKEALHNVTLDVINHYSDNYTTSEWDLQVDYVQIGLQCCGETNYTDWFHSHWGEEHIGYVPWSCSKNVSFNNEDYSPIDTNVTANLQWIHKNGCYQTLLDFIMSILDYLIGAFIGFIVLLVLGIVCSVILCCLRQNDETPYFSLN